MRKFLFLVVLVAAGYTGLTQYRHFSLGGGQASGVESAATEESASDGALERAQESRASGVQLQGQGTVIKVLSDDNDGICLLSALRFHDLTSQNPHEVWIAIGPKNRKPTLEYPSIKVVRYGDERFEIGLEDHQLEGTLVRVYSVARTVVDLFSYRNKVGLDVALEALREGWKARRFTLVEINRIAGLCRMRTVMKPYLESLIT